MTHHPAPGAVPLLVAALVATLVALAGCSEEGGGTPSAPTTPDATTSAPESPSAPESSASESPDDPAPAALPASGPELSLDGVSLRMPAGWVLDTNQAGFLASGNHDAPGPGSISLSQLPSLDLAASGAQLERSTDKTSFGGRGTVLEPVDVGGVEMRHLTGRNGTQVDDEFVALVDGDIIGIGFGLGPGLDDAQRQELIASVLASVSWR